MLHRITTGRRKRPSIPRRSMTDFMWLTSDAPAVLVQRPMNLRKLVEARNAQAIRLPWTGIFIKAFAIVAQEFPQLRQLYLRYPWPHIYEHPHSVANLNVERLYVDEPMAFGCVINDPASLSLEQIGGRIRWATRAPLENIKNFQRLIRVTRLPVIIRRPLLWLMYAVAEARAHYLGTFGISVVTAMGADLLQTHTAWSALISYGIIDKNGAVDMRFTFDHRLLDGATAAHALERLEEVLTGPILQELREGAAPRAKTKAKVPQGEGLAEAG